MKLYTIGFTQKSAEVFFEKLKKHNVALLLDIRLQNTSQLAGFAKGQDLGYFMREVCGADYIHADKYAPTKEIFDAVKAKAMKMPEFNAAFEQLMRERGDYKGFMGEYGKYASVCLLCSEPKPSECHRGVLADLLAGQFPGLEVEHL